MLRQLVVCAIVVVGLAGCSGTTPGPAPETTRATSSAPPVSPLESWINRLCVVELESALDPHPDQVPITDLDSLPAAKRRVIQWANAIADAARAMITRLDELGPPPEGGGEDYAGSFDTYRKGYAELVRAVDASRIFIDSAKTKAELESSTPLIELQLLAASTPLDSPTLFGTLADESEFCIVS